MKQVHEKARSQGRIPQERMGHSFAQIAEVRIKDIGFHVESFINFFPVTFYFSFHTFDKLE